MPGSADTRLKIHPGPDLWCNIDRIILPQQLGYSTCFMNHLSWRLLKTSHLVAYTKR